MVEQTHGYCTRCARTVDVEFKHAYTTRRWLRLYLYMPLMLLPAFPILAADYILALPMCMLYMLGIGPVLTIVREPGLCCECGAMVAEGGAAVAQTP